jgi:hypothetical protein
MLKPSARALLLVMASCLCLTACDKSTPETPAKRASGANNSKGPKASGVGDEMVAAVAPETSNAMIGVYFGLTKAPVLNEGFSLDINIVPHQEFSSVSAHFFGQNGLTLVSGDSFGPLADAKPGKAIKHQLVLMPAVEGLYMISVSVETTGAEGTVSRVFSIPVVVAPPAPATPPAAAPPRPPAPAANPAGG